MKLALADVAGPLGERAPTRRDGSPRDHDLVRTTALLALRGAR